MNVDFAMNYTFFTDPLNTFAIGLTNKKRNKGLKKERKGAGNSYREMFKGYRPIGKGHGKNNKRKKEGFLKHAAKGVGKFMTSELIKEVIEAVSEMEVDPAAVAEAAVLAAAFDEPYFQDLGSVQYYSREVGKHLQHITQCTDPDVSDSLLLLRDRF